MRLKLEADAPEELWKEHECEWCPFSYTTKDEWDNIKYKCPIKNRGTDCPAKVVKK
jgi:hypothetical protein